MPITLITGAGAGIGFATTLHLAREGHQVYASVRNLDTADHLRNAIDRDGLKVTIVELDVTSDQSVWAAVDRVVSLAGGIDNLVNNAGIGGGGALEEVPLERFRDVMETNLFGVIRCTKAALPHMRRAGGGTIVALSSISGRIAITYTPYAASKWALEGVMENLAKEVRQFGIRVALVEPGFTWTPLFWKRISADDTPSPSPTAYTVIGARLGKLHDRATEYASPPAIVAERIAHALSAKKPKLRYLCGPDAEALARTRLNLSDEKWIELLGGDDERAWDQFLDQIFAKSSPRPDN